MNNQEKIKELEYLNNEHRGVIGILMDEREVLRAEIEKLKSEVELYRTDAEKLTMRLVDCVVNHPAELTDEEINEIAKIHYWTMNEERKFDAISFARAILRKAQDK